MFITSIVLVALTLFCGQALAADDLTMSALKLTTNPDGSQEYSVTLQILIFMILTFF